MRGASPCPEADPRSPIIVCVLPVTSVYMCYNKNSSHAGVQTEDKKRVQWAKKA